MKMNLNNFRIDPEHFRMLFLHYLDLAGRASLGDSCIGFPIQKKQCFKKHHFFVACIGNRIVISMTSDVFFHSTRPHLSCCKIKTNKSFFKILDPGERCDLPLSNAPKIIANGALTPKLTGLTSGVPKLYNCTQKRHQGYPQSHIGSHMYCITERNILFA